MSVGGLHKAGTFLYLFWLSSPAEMPSVKFKFETFQLSMYYDVFIILFFRARWMKIYILSSIVSQQTMWRGQMWRHQSHSVLVTSKQSL